MGNFAKDKEGDYSSFYLLGKEEKIVERGKRTLSLHLSQQTLDYREREGELSSLESTGERGTGWSQIQRGGKHDGLAISNRGKGENGRRRKESVSRR